MMWRDVAAGRMYVPEPAFRENFGAAPYLVLSAERRPNGQLLGGELVTLEVLLADGRQVTWNGAGGHVWPDEEACR